MTRASPICASGFGSQESAKKRGVDFVHEAPTFDSRLDHIMPQVASTGRGRRGRRLRSRWLAGLLRHQQPRGKPQSPVSQQGDGTFKDVAASVGLADVNRRGTGVSMGAVWGDYDNDGWEDLFLYRYGQPELFRNDSGRAGSFPRAPGCRAG